MPLKAPPDLSRHSKAWYLETIRRYAGLETVHLRILTLLCRAWDEWEVADQTVRELGQTYQDQHGCPRPRPEVRIARDSRAAVCKLVRSLMELGIFLPGQPGDDDLDDDDPGDNGTAPYDRLSWRNPVRDQP